MVTDRWSRSWHATVNGIEQPISGANFIFRAVPVTRGNNRVEFSFQPVGMPWPGHIQLVCARRDRSRFLSPRLPVRRLSLTSARVISPALLPAAE